MADNKVNRVLTDVHEDCGEPPWLERIAPFASAVLDRLGISGWELSILFCRDPFMQELNREYRGMDSPTDVLSFEQGDAYCDEEGGEWTPAGDIAISLDTVHRHSIEFSVSMDEELRRLLIHGILHLAGHDHSDNSPDQKMLILQEKILGDLEGLYIIEPTQQCGTQA